MARIRGCDGKPAPSPVEHDEDKEANVIYRYWNCPKKFIPVSIYKWYNEYKYHKNFPSAIMPAYENIARRFITAVEVYESTLRAYQEKLK